MMDGGGMLAHSFLLLVSFISASSMYLGIVKFCRTRTCLVNFGVVRPCVLSIGIMPLDLLCALGHAVLTAVWLLPTVHAKLSGEW